MAFGSHTSGTPSTPTTSTWSTTTMAASSGPSTRETSGPIAALVVDQPRALIALRREIELSHQRNGDSPKEADQ